MNDAVVSDEGATAQAESAEDIAGASSPPGPALPRGLRLAKLAGTHSLVFMLSLSLFAAADSWSTVTGLGIATFLCLLTGALAGVTISTLIHEWFHYLGARLTGARYNIPSKLGLFVFDWDYNANQLRQFLVMSVAGSVGGLVAIVLLWNAVPADSWGRAALHGGALAGFVFGSCVEWPVLRRIRAGGDPLAELSKINESVLARSFVVSLLAGVACTVILAS